MEVIALATYRPCGISLLYSITTRIDAEDGTASSDLGLQAVFISSPTSISRGPTPMQPRHTWVDWQLLQSLHLRGPIIPEIRRQKLGESFVISSKTTRSPCKNAHRIPFAHAVLYKCGPNVSWSVIFWWQTMQDCRAETDSDETNA